MLPGPAAASPEPVYTITSPGDGCSSAREAGNYERNVLLDNRSPRSRWKSLPDRPYRHPNCPMRDYRITTLALGEEEAGGRVS